MLPLPMNPGMMSNPYAGLRYDPGFTWIWFVERNRDLMPSPPQKSGLIWKPTPDIEPSVMSRTNITPDQTRRILSPRFSRVRFMAIPSLAGRSTRHGR